MPRSAVGTPPGRFGDARLGQHSPAPVFAPVEAADYVVCSSLRNAEHSVRICVRLFESSGSCCRASVSLGKIARLDPSEVWLRRFCGWLHITVLRNSG